MSTTKSKPIQSKVIKEFWFVWADKAKWANLTTIYTGNAMRFNVLPAATMYINNPTTDKHTAVIFNIGMHQPIQGNDIEYMKAHIEHTIERYLQEREKRT